MKKKMIMAMLALAAVAGSAQAGSVFMAYNSSSYGDGANWWWDGLVADAATIAEIRYDAIVDTQVGAPKAFWIGVNAPASLTITNSGGFTDSGGAEYTFVGNAYAGAINLANSSTLTMPYNIFLGNPYNPGGTGTLNVTGGGTLDSSLAIGRSSSTGVANIVNGTVLAYDLTIGATSTVFIGEFGTLKFAYNSDAYLGDMLGAFNAFVADGRLFTSAGRTLQFAVDGVSGWGVVTSVAPIVPPPAINIAPSGANVVISWSASGNWVLESTALLSPASWTPVQTNGSPATIPALGDQFFRLKSQ